MAAPDPLALAAAMPFAVAAGVDVTAATAEEVRGRLAWTPARCTTAGVLHGGAIMTLADTLGAICAFLNLPPGAGTSTIESKTNFFAAVRSGHVEGVTRPLHVGRRTIVVQTDVRDGTGRRVAQVTQTQAVLTD
jgi:1,4-dihydroxy-2-naphthoyl-CoA hydrolase